MNVGLKNVRTFQETVIKGANIQSTLHLKIGTKWAFWI